MIGAILASILLLAALSLGASAVVEHFRRWPEPAPRAFGCDRCRCAFHDARWLGLHMRAQHPETFDDARRAPGSGPGLLVASPDADTGDDNLGCSVSGRPAVSKSADGGSIPSHPATIGAAP